MPAQKFSLNEKRRLYLLLKEQKERGMDTSKKVDYSPVSSDWGVDENGYFIRDDGFRYEPSEQQYKFVHSTARYSGYYGPRGCIDATTKLGGVPVGDIKIQYPVSSVFGSFISGIPFVKGRDHLYRILTQTGLEVLVTQQHRFLSPTGWLPLSLLHVGDLILADGTEDDWKKVGTKSSYQDSCSLDFRLGGELHNLSVRASLDILQQLHSIAFGSSALGPPLIFRLSTVNFLSQMLLRFFFQFHSQQVSSELLFQNVDIFFQFLLFHVQQNTSVSHLLLEYQRFSSAHISSCAESLVLSKSELLFLDEGLEQCLFQLDVSPGYVDQKHPYTFCYDPRILPESNVLLGGLGVSYDEYSTFSALWMSVHREDSVSHPSCIRFGQVQNRYPQLTYNHISSLLMGQEQFLGYSLLQFYKLKQMRFQNTVQSSLPGDFSLFLELLKSDSQFLGDLDFSLNSPSVNYTNSSIRFDKIQDIKYDKESEFYDLEIPFSHNYNANGLFHHNSGKTAAGIQKALQKIKQGESGSVMNPDMENFKFSTWPELRRWIPWNMVVPRQRYRQSAAWDAARPFTIVFVNGAKMVCKGLKDPDSARGPNMNWLWYDEAGRDKTGMGWKLAIAGVRIGKDPQAWATYTPKDFYHWTYDFFVKQVIGEEMKALLAKMPAGYQLIDYYHGTRKDNAAHLDPMFYASLESAYPGGYLRTQELEGDYANEGGTIGTRAWFNNHYFDAAPEWAYKKVRYWDLAASEKKMGNDPDETVGTLLSVDEPKERFCVEHQVGGYWLWDKIKENIRTVARLDGTGVEIWVEQEPASGGKNQVAEIKNFLKDEGFVVKGHNPRDDGDRVMAANVWFGEASQGKFYIVRGLWNEKFLIQVDTFSPDEKTHDDRITSVSGGRHVIAPIRKWKKIPFLAVGLKKPAVEEKKPEPA